MWTTAERAKNAAVERQLALLRQEVKEQEEKRKAQQKSYNENMAQLKEKMERKEKNLLEETVRILEHKLKVSLGVAGHSINDSTLFPQEGKDKNVKSCIQRQIQRPMIQWNVKKF